MGIIIHADKNKTVATIADRDNIVRKRNDMKVYVEDATDDLNVQSGGALYRYNAVDDSWFLLSVTDKRVMSFITENIEISDDKVIASNIPADNEIWDIAVIKDDTVYANEFDYTVESGVVTCSFDEENEYDGYTLQFTYAYGSIGQQLNAVVDTLSDRLDALESGYDCGEL